MQKLILKNNSNNNNQSNINDDKGKEEIINDDHEVLPTFSLSSFISEINKILIKPNETVNDNDYNNYYVNKGFSLKSISNEAIEMNRMMLANKLLNTSDVADTFGVEFIKDIKPEYMLDYRCALLGFSLDHGTSTRGDCLFDSISRNIERLGVNYSASQLRKLAVQYVRQHLNDDVGGGLTIRHWITGGNYGNVANWVQKLSNTSEFADEICVYAISNIIQSNIIVIKSDRNWGAPIFFIRPINPTANMTYISNNNQIHFTSLIDNLEFGTPQIETNKIEPDVNIKRRESIKWEDIEEPDFSVPLIWEPEISDIKEPSGPLKSESVGEKKFVMGFSKSWEYLIKQIKNRSFLKGLDMKSDIQEIKTNIYLNIASNALNSLNIKTTRAGKIEYAKLKSAKTPDAALIIRNRLVVYDVKCKCHYIDSNAVGMVKRLVEENYSEVITKAKGSVRSIVISLNKEHQNMFTKDDSSDVTLLLEFLQFFQIKSVGKKDISGKFEQGILNAGLSPGIFDYLDDNRDWEARKGIEELVEDSLPYLDNFYRNSKEHLISSKSMMKELGSRFGAMSSGQSQKEYQVNKATQTALENGGILKLSSETQKKIFRLFRQPNIVYFPVNQRRQQFEDPLIKAISVHMLKDKHRSIDNKVLNAISESINLNTQSDLLSRLRKNHERIRLKGLYGSKILKGTGYDNWSTNELINESRIIQDALNTGNQFLHVTKLGTQGVKLDKQDALNHGIGLKKEVNKTTKHADPVILGKIEKEENHKNAKQIPAMDMEYLIKAAIGNLDCPRFQMPKITLNDLYDNVSLNKVFKVIFGDCKKDIIDKILNSDRTQYVLWNCIFMRDIVLSSITTMKNTEVDGFYSMNVNYSPLTQCYYMVSPPGGGNSTGLIKVAYQGDHEARILNLKYNSYNRNGKAYHVSKGFRLNLEYCKTWSTVLGNYLGSCAHMCSYGSSTILDSYTVMSMFTNLSLQVINLMDINYLLVKNVLGQVNPGKIDFKKKISELIINNITVSSWMFQLMKYLPDILTTFPKFIQGKPGRVNIEVLGFDIRNIDVLFSLMYFKNAFPKDIFDDKIKLLTNMFDREIGFERDYQKTSTSFENYGIGYHEKVYGFADFEEAIYSDKNEKLWNDHCTYMPTAIFPVIESMANREGWKPTDPAIYGSTAFEKPVDSASANRVNIPTSKETTIGTKGPGISSDTVRNALIIGMKRAAIFEKYHLMLDLERSNNFLLDDTRRSRRNRLIKYKIQFAKEFAKLDETDKEDLLDEMETIDREFDTVKEHFGERAHVIQEYHIDEKLRIYDRFFDYYALRDEEKKNREMGKNSRARAPKSRFGKTFLAEDKPLDPKVADTKVPDDMMMYELILHEVAMYSNRLILTIALKPQTGFGKRIFFVQMSYNRNLNQWADKLHVNFIVNREDDIIGVQGNVKYIKFQNSLGSFVNTPMTGITEDKTKYGDKYPPEALITEVKALYKSNYLSKGQAALVIHAIQGMMKRIILEPGEVTDFMERTGATATRLSKEFEGVEIDFKGTSFEKPFTNLMEHVDFAGLKRKLDCEVFPNGVDTRWGSTLPELHPHHIKKAVGFTLGVYNFLSTVLSCGIKELNMAMEERIFGKILSKHFAHSDDSASFVPGACPTKRYLDNINISDPFTSLLEYRELRLGNRNHLSDLEVSDIEDNRRLAKSIYPYLNLLADLFYGRMMGQTASLLKCMIAPNVFEILQVCVVLRPDETGLKLYPDVLVPTIRYSAVIGVRGEGTSFAGEVSSRVSVVYDIINADGNSMLITSLLYFCNFITCLEFRNMDCNGKYPIEIGGAWMSIPGLISVLGMKADFLRKLSNRVGSRCIKLLLPPDLEEESPILDSDQQTAVYIGRNEADDLLGSVLNRPMITFMNNRKASKGGGIITSINGIKASNLKDALAEARKGNEVDELLGNKTYSVALTMSLTSLISKRHNSKIDKIPGYLIESSQMGYGKMKICVNLPGINELFTTVNEYQTYIKNLSEGEDYIEGTKAYKLIRDLDSEKIRFLRFTVLDVGSKVRKEHGKIDSKIGYKRLLTKFTESSNWNYFKKPLSLLMEINVDPIKMSRSDLNELIMGTRTYEVHPEIITDQYREGLQTVSNTLKAIDVDHKTEIGKSQILRYKETIRRLLNGNAIKAIGKVENPTHMRLVESLTRNYSYRYNYTISFATATKAMLSDFNESIPVANKTRLVKFHNIGVMLEYFRTVYEILRRDPSTSNRKDELLQRGLDFYTGNRIDTINGIILEPLLRSLISLKDRQSSYQSSSILSLLLLLRHIGNIDKLIIAETNKNSENECMSLVIDDFKLFLTVFEDKTIIIEFTKSMNSYSYVEMFQLTRMLMYYSRLPLTKSLSKETQKMDLYEFIIKITKDNARVRNFGEISVINKNCGFGQMNENDLAPKAPIGEITTVRMNNKIKGNKKKYLQTNTGIGLINITIPKNKSGKKIKGTSRVKTYTLVPWIIPRNYFYCSNPVDESRVSESLLQIAEQVTYNTTTRAILNFLWSDYYNRSLNEIVDEFSAKLAIYMIEFFTGLDISTLQFVLEVEDKPSDDEQDAPEPEEEFDDESSEPDTIRYTGHERFISISSKIRFDETLEYDLKKNKFFLYSIALGDALQRRVDVAKVLVNHNYLQFRKPLLITVAVLEDMSHIYDRDGFIKDVLDSTTNLNQYNLIWSNFRNLLAGDEIVSNYSSWLFSYDSVCNIYDNIPLEFLNDKLKKIFSSY